jgi:hypothetical protein
MNRKFLDEIRNNQFGVIESPESWLYSALALKKSADVLYTELVKEFRASEEMFAKFDEADEKQIPFEMPEQALVHVSHRGSYMLLAGLSIENLIKAVAVGTDSLKYIADDKKKLKHSTIELFKELNISLSEEEEKFLRLLEENVVWAGRYPTPIQARFLFKDQDIKDRQSPSRFNINVEPKQFNELFDKLTGILSEITPVNLSNYK